MQVAPVAAAAGAAAAPRRRGRGSSTRARRAGGGARAVLGGKARSPSRTPRPAAAPTPLSFASGLLNGRGGGAAAAPAEEPGGEAAPTPDTVVASLFVTAATTDALAAAAPEVGQPGHARRLAHLVSSTVRRTVVAPHAIRRRVRPRAARHRSHTC
jgi:hypothetical protein